MSTQYPGGFITKSPVAPTSTAASGIWTVDQALQYVKAGTWPSPPVFIEDLFSTYLYTGNGSTQTITNGIDLAGKGGMIWIKDRTTATYSWVVDTDRGFTKGIQTQTTGAQQTSPAGKDVTAFLSTGFSLGPDGAEQTNTSADKFVSRTFAKQPKFFDVLTYTGNGVDARAISHSLGATPGCIIIKKTSDVGYWVVGHRSLNSGTGNGSLFLNTVDAYDNSGSFYFGNRGTGTYIAPTSTQFTVSYSADVNANGATYVAYLFAHDAGGFPANGGGSTNGISCGSFTTDGSGNATVTLGYEPQWLLLKRVSGTGNWLMYDTMRGMPVGTGAAQLLANATDAEANIGGSVSPTATGFSTTGQLSASSTYIYIAIRRGPMKTPTVGTSVFGVNARTGTGANATVTGNTLPDDAVLIKNRGSAVADLLASRLTGTGYLVTSSAAAEVSAGTTILQANPWDVMDGVNVGTTSSITNASANTFINYLFSRAPGFFDVVCYTGNATNPRTISHNLNVAPELMAIKGRTDASYSWSIYPGPVGAASGILYFNQSDSLNTGSLAYNKTAPTSSVFTIGNVTTNASAVNYVAYLWATVAGVSKVGSYTGTAALQTINCGFTAGARFVLIKRTDDIGDWYTYDSTRGLSSGTDPYFLLNTTAAEVTGTNYVDTDTTGFKVTAAAPAGLNAVGGTYIFLAIA